MPSFDRDRQSGNLLVLAICTYRRTHGLLALLNQISRLEGRDRAIVLIVDNDPGRSAEQVVNNFNPDSNLSIVYTHATPQGISTARNVALDFAGERALPVLFIDDDELPEPQWLLAMLSTCERFPSAIIAGPVRPEFAGELPNWAPNGSFWRRREYADGQSVRLPVGAGNTLFPTKVTVGALRFDHDFDLVGAEDTHFTLKWLQAKEQIVWSAEAVAVEHIPVERLTLEYARERVYSASIAYQHVIQKLAEPPRAKTFARVARSWTFAVFCWSYGTLRSSPPMLANASLHAAKARGTWAGMRGRRFNRWTGYQVDVLADPQLTSTADAAARNQPGCDQQEETPPHMGSQRRDDNQQPTP